MSTAFGDFLHTVRKRTKGIQVAKSSDISYVYLLDLEKGARPVPSKTVLLKLADNLPFAPGEREHFFDLAAMEVGDVPLDVSCYLCENRELIEIIRKMKEAKINTDAFRELLENSKTGEAEIDK